MTISDTAISEAFRNLPAIITALVAGLAWWTSRKAAKSAGVAAEVTIATSNKADTIIKKAEETDTKANILIEGNAKIHELTNSKLSATTSSLDVANEKIEGLQKLINLLLEREAHVEKAVKETNGILAQKSDSDPLPVVDDKVASKIDGIVTPKLDAIQDTVDEQKKG